MLTVGYLKDNSQLARMFGEPNSNRKGCHWAHSGLPLLCCLLSEDLDLVLTFALPVRASKVSLRNFRASGTELAETRLWFCLCLSWITVQVKHERL